MAQAITYRTGERRSDLRTVIVDDVRTVVLVAPERLELLAAKLLHGTQCGHRFWDEVLGLDPASDDFIVPRDSVVRVREICVAVKATHKGRNV